MYQITRTEYGIHLVFGGVMSTEEVAQWRDEFCTIADEFSKPFGVFVDMRTLVPLDRDAQKDMEYAQRYARENGMRRSAVILNNPVTTAQFKRLAGMSGIFRNERYIDASAAANWEEIGLNWVIEGIEPEEAPMATSNSARSDH